MKAVPAMLIAFVLVLAACTAPVAVAPPQVAALESSQPQQAAIASTSTPVLLAPGARLATRTPLPGASAVPVRPMQSTRTIRTDSTATTAASAGSAAFSVGVPAGNAYNPFSLALDPGRRLAYVYHATSDRGAAVIAVIDISARNVGRLIPVGDTPLGSSNALLLTPDGRRLFLQENGDSTVWTIDTETGSARRLFSAVNAAALSQDAALLFVAGQDTLTAYTVADLQGGQPQIAWQNKASFTRLAVNGARLAALNVTEGQLSILDAVTGTQLAQAPVGWADTVSPGLDGGWGVVVNGEAPRLVRFDGALKKLGETDIPYLNTVTFDAARKRFLAGGSHYEGKGQGRAVVMAIDALDGKVTQEVAWPTLNRPDVFAALGEDRLLAFVSGGPAILTVLDAATLNPLDGIPMGARVDDVLVDGAKTLYAADDLGRLHVLQLPEGEEVNLWDGGAPLALDAANSRLYVNRSGRVVALDTRSGQAVAQFPQGGYPAADPRRDVIYIANKGITLYDRSGKKLGDLPSTFADPKGFSGSPSAEAVHVNPVTGHMAVTLYNGIPGSNGGTFLRIYEPQTDKYVTPPAPHSFILDVLSDSKGNWYVAYSTARNQEAVQVLSPDGKELRRLDRRTGYLVLDEPADNLYLVLEGRVTRLAASTLTALQTFSGPDELRGLAFSPAAANIYLFDGAGPRITPMKAADLGALNLKPGPGAPSRDAGNYGLAVTALGKQRVLVGQFDNTYLSADGQNWQRLLLGLNLQYAQITAAGDGTLFVTGASPYGGEGVWRSKDGGQTWVWLAGGLTDLAPTDSVLARSADEAYFSNPSQGLLRWDPAARRWTQVSPPAVEGQSTAYQLAPDGVLFRTRAGMLERSGDRGATWERLGTEAQTGRPIGFSALYTATHTVFSVMRSSSQITGLQRSTDGGKTWQAANTGTVFGSDGFQPETATGFGRTYLLFKAYNGEPTLLRTKDYGATWELAPAETAAGVEHIAVDPLDGRLWLGIKGGVVGLDPEKLRWTVLGATPSAATLATPMRPPAPTRTPVPTATAGPCKQASTGGDGEINNRGLGLGCPTSAASNVQMARQRFQHGQMIWRADLKFIYVLSDDGRWAGYSDTWNEGDPVDDPALKPPAGTQQPVRGFGKVWREQLGGAQAKLGWAVEKEAGVQALAQPWQYGTVLRFGGEVIVLHSDGRWQ